MTIAVSRARAAGYEFQNVTNIPVALADESCKLSGRNGKDA
jgi:hypothetical protein